MSSQLHYRTCNLCEALCGLEIEHERGDIVAIRGDKADPLSRGHICHALSRPRMSGAVIRLPFDAIGLAPNTRK